MFSLFSLRRLCQGKNNGTQTIGLQSTDPNALIGGRKERNREISHCNWHLAIHQLMRAMWHDLWIIGFSITIPKGIDRS